MEFNQLINILIKGFVIGISVSAPLGPIALVCIQKTLNKGIVPGLISGLGAALADAFYATLAAFGVSIVLNFIDTQQVHLRMIGGTLLVFMGVKTFFSNTIKQVRKQRFKKSNSIGDFLSVFFLTLSNPLSIIFFGAVFAGLGLVEPSNGNISSFIILFGVLFGAITWWTLLTSIINIFRNKIRLRSLWWINKIAGALIAVLGVLALISVLLFKKL